MTERSEFILDSTKESMTRFYCAFRKEFFEYSLQESISSYLEVFFCRLLRICYAFRVSKISVLMPEQSLQPFEKYAQVIEKTIIVCQHWFNQIAGDVISISVYINSKEEDT
jgi:hypothetical protein